MDFHFLFLAFGVLESLFQFLSFGSVFGYHATAFLVSFYQAFLGHIEIRLVVSIKTASPIVTFHRRHSEPHSRESLQANGYFLGKCTEAIALTSKLLHNFQFVNVPKRTA
jgi:hypothetical protein